MDQQPLSRGGREEAFPLWVFLALTLCAAALAIWSWGCWPDVQVDFGRELYAAWRVSEGEVLYRDLAWFNGPLSVWWNALWFHLLGTSLQTLFAVNLGLVLVTLALIVASVARWAGAAGAWAAGFAFLGISAFGQYATIGNYNFVAPYSHELPHGLILALAALAALGRLARTDRLGWAALAGFALGLAFLTKAEVFLAGALAAVVRLVFYLAEPSSRGRRGRSAALLLGGAALAPLLAFAWISRTLAPSDALVATLGSWPYAGNAEVRALPFYQAMMGLDAPRAHLMTTGRWAIGEALLLLLLLVPAWRVDRVRGGTRAARATALVAGLALGLGALALVEDAEVARPFPVFLVLIALGLCVRWRRRASGSRIGVPIADHLGLVVLALGLLGKVLLHPRLDHYGFVLALPATAVLAAFVAGVLPRRLEERGRGGPFLRAAGLGLVTALVLTHLARSHTLYHGDPGKPVPVGEGADRFRAGARGDAMARAARDLEQRLTPDETLLVLPEGVMLNYLTRRRTPTPFLNFMPPELIFWGEEAVVEALRASPPDAVVIVHKDTREYGKSWFGSPGYGATILSWIRARYGVAATYGATPLVGQEFGVQVLVPK